MTLHADATIEVCNGHMLVLLLFSVVRLQSTVASYANEYKTQDTAALLTGIRPAAPKSERHDTAPPPGTPTGTARGAFGSEPCGTGTV